MNQRFSGSTLLSDWYEVKELVPSLFLVDEQDHVSFYVIKHGDRALFIDTGLGLARDKIKCLLEYLKINSFDVLLTHTHCDHIGLNYLANAVHLSRGEWLKYQELNEIHQISMYYKMLAKVMPWPKEMSGAPITHPWKATHFISENSEVRFYDWNLQVKILPGHSRAHCIFIEQEKNIIFLGDLVISGTNYVHLKDSSIEDYLSSLKALENLLLDHADAILLPCHNDVPLNKNHIIEVIRVLELIKSGKLKHKEIWAGDDFSFKALLYEIGTVRITVAEEQLEKFTKNL